MCVVVAGENRAPLTGLKTVVRRKGKAEAGKVKVQSVPEVKEEIEGGATETGGRKRPATDGRSKEDITDQFMPWEARKIRKCTVVKATTTDEGDDVSEDSPPGSGRMCMT